MMNQDYLHLNREAWNQKTEQHVHSAFYELDAFLRGKNVLRSIELELLGDIKDKRILHLQCHFGLDTLSLARMGAAVTGVDLSDTAIRKAHELNGLLGLDAKFICCNLYDLSEHLSGEFDIVFTSYGTIGWLPDLTKWAQLIEQFLRPGGQFIMVDFHPFVWTFDNDMQAIAYDYFKGEPIIEEVQGTYADRSAPILTKTVSWNHGMSEILNSLISCELTLHQLEEYDYSPYDCLPNLEKQGEDVYRFRHISQRIPIVYSIVAGKQLI